MNEPMTEARYTVTDMQIQFERGREQGAKAERERIAAAVEALACPCGRCPNVAAITRLAAIHEEAQS